MVALCADGPMADREIEVDEPRPTLELTQHAQGRRAVHRYRLADVTFVRVDENPGRLRPLAVYVYAGDVGRATVARAA
jgi:hypothetical protein